MSISQTLRSINFGKGLRNFPVASVIAVLMSVLLIWLSHQEGDPQTRALKLLSAGYLSFLVAIATAATTYNWHSNRKTPINIIVPILIGLIAYTFIPQNLFEGSSPDSYRFLYQYPAWVLICHLIISFGPYIQRSGDRDFWEYNTRLLISFFESLFFSLVLFLGLALAVLALDHLFGLSANDKIYSDLAIVLFGAFHSIYFLSKFPIPRYDNQINPPARSYIVLVTYILVPVVLIYLIILYAYGAKLGLSTTLPQGWLGKLSLSFSTVGLLTYLMGYHIDSTPEVKLSTIFRKWFPAALIIPAILLIIAIFRRLMDYGVTENRYIVALLAIWLLGFAIIKILLPSLSIQWIPISLSIITLISILAGPWSMFGSTLSNQSQRLKEQLISNGLLVDRQLVPFKNQQQQDVDWSVLQVLDRRSDFSLINEWLDSDIDFQDSTIIGDQSTSSWLRNHLGINNSLSEQRRDLSYFNYNALPSGEISLKGYENLIYFESYKNETQSAVTLTNSGKNIAVNLGDYQTEISVAEALAQWKELTPNQTIDQKDLYLTIDIGNYQVKIFFSHIAFRVAGHSTFITDCSGFILY